MTTTEILNVIHEERVELEVYQELQKWMVADRAAWIDRAMDAEAIIRCVNKIATQNGSPKNALQGIINICECD